MTTTYLGTEVTVEIVAMTCNAAGCGIPFGLSREFIDARRRDHATWYCPNGHGRCWSGQNREERLAEELAAARRIASNERERRQVAERQRSAARGQVTKIKRRVGRGVCPCCNRTFADVARHMAGQHPKFSDSE